MPRPLTPPLPGDVAELAEPAEAADCVAEERAALRFADFILSPDGTEIWCVQERHQGGKIARAIVAVPLDGSAADDAGAIRELVTGPDFFAFPTLSPDGGPAGLGVLEPSTDAMGWDRIARWADIRWHGRARAAG